MLAWSSPVLSRAGRPREDNINSDPAREEDGRERARARRKTPVGRKETKTKREHRGREEKRLICEVNVSPKVGFCQVQPVRPREPEIYICVHTPNIYTCPPSLSLFLANRRFFSLQSFIGDILHFRSTCYTYGSHYSEGEICESSPERFFKCAACVWRPAGEASGASCVLQIEKN